MPETNGLPPAAENQLVVYSAAERKYCAGLLEGFATRHPGIEVEFRDGISVALHERHLTKLAAGEPEADVIWSSAMDLQMVLVLKGDALPYHSPEACNLPPGAVYRDMAYATTLEPLVTLINRDLFDARVPAGSLGEITAALESESGRFRGRIACYDIERNGLGFLALLLEARRHEEFDAFMRLLAECKPRLCGSNPELVEEVASGRAVLGCHVLGAYALRAARAHHTLAIASSSAPPLAVSRIALISRSAPHPGAARLFLDYLLSQDGQRRLHEAGLYPIRPEPAPGAPRAVAAASIRIDRGCDDLLNPRRRRGLLRQWREAVGRNSAFIATMETGGLR